ncbi:hypothetical protein PpBr36_01423 [Pyricularia pennisetigena]|uniref:hypothetical protein n=1 Tax=Pyricularia pennisetigena TaxID=1578925 RepID=UPI001150749A|nr:hypothetical protein PpBr36_01423 [Pyricularia pennisetigena]TLS28451.1 hypothetical protein PpBr36_01423 [Pyricularia pennisetigena]
MGLEWNPGMQLACAMWALTAMSLALVALRLYTRIRIIKFVGAEDHMYAWTGLFLLLFTCFIQVGVHHGLGRSFWSLGLDDSSDAIFWTYVANTFAITGNAMAKLSMGLFLLRVVQITWQRVALWALIAITAGTSIALTVMLWNQTTPVKASWDPLRTPGTWNIQIQPMSVGLGAWSSVCDFFFAIFPWLFIWSLRMPQREKLMLAGGMSLGVVAGVCGIVRTVVLSRLDVFDYTLNFVPYFGWAGAEIAVAMFCIGIPTLRPLYMKKRHGVTHETVSNGNGSGQPATGQSDDRLPRFTMMQAKQEKGGLGNTAHPSTIPTTSTTCSSEHDLEANNSALDDSRVLAAAAAAMSKPIDLESRAASPAGRDHHHHSAPLSPTTLQAMRLAAFTRFPDAVGHMQAPPARPMAAHVRSASNNAAYGHTRRHDDDVIIGAPVARPATSHTRSYNGSVASSHTSHDRLRRDDSVDLILGLYDHNQRTHGARPPNGTPGDGRGIWITNEVHIGREDNINWPLRS